MIYEKIEKNVNKKVRLITKIFVLVFAGMFVFAQAAGAATWDGGGATNNFSEAANWDTDVVPIENAVFDGTSTKDCVIDIDLSLVTFQINSGYTGTVTQGTSDITLSSDFTQSDGTFAGGSGTLDFNKSFILNGGTFTATSGNFFSSNPRFNSVQFTINGGTFNHNNGTIIMDERGTNFDINSTVNFFNFTINNEIGSSGFGISIVSGDTIVVNGTLSLTDGNIIGGGKIRALGDVTIGPDFDGGTGNLEFSGTAVQTFTDNGGTKPTGIWSLNKTGGTVVLASDLLLNNSGNNFNFTSGTITTDGNTVNLGTRPVTSGGGYVIGNLLRTFDNTDARNFDVGTANGYSPVNVNVTSLNTNPSSLTVRAVQGVHPNSPNPAQSLQRYWSLTETGDFSAILTFNYLEADVPGTVSESELELRRYTGSGVIFDTIAAAQDTTDNTVITDNSIADFSDWTMFKVAPTAASTSVGGRVVTDTGRSVFRAFIKITDMNGYTRSTLTNPFGYYLFNGVPVGETYVVSAMHKRYQFENPTQTITVNEAVTNLNFTAQNLVSNGGLASIEGKILSEAGRGLGGIRVELSGGNLEKPVYTETDKQGRFKFKDVKSGGTYILLPHNEKLIFSEPTKVIYLTDPVTEINFQVRYKWK